MSTITPVMGEPPTTATIPSAPLVRPVGRPRIHEDAAACARAYRARKRAKRELARQQALDEKNQQLQSVVGVRRTKTYYNPDGTEFVGEFLVPSAKELKLVNEVLCAHKMGVNNGLYLTDAPKGCGVLVSGGYDAHELPQINTDINKEDVQLADGRYVPLKNGKRVKPKGWGSHQDENLEHDIDEPEWKSEWQDTSELECYQDGCTRLVEGIRTDHGKEQFHCYLHAPIGDLNDVNQGMPRREPKQTKPQPRLLPKRATAPSFCCIGASRGANAH